MKSSSNNGTPAYVQQLQTALLRRREVEKLTALSRSGIYALMATGDFPRNIKLSTKSVAWLEIEVREWIACRIIANRAEA